jgi:hypothetical protein
MNILQQQQKQFTVGPAVEFHRAKPIGITFVLIRSLEFSCCTFHLKNVGHFSKISKLRRRVTFNAVSQTMKRNKRTKGTVGIQWLHIN